MSAPIYVPVTKLDANQVLKYAYDDPTQSIRVTASITGNISGPQEVIISHTDDSIRLGDGTTLITSTTIGPDTGLDVNIIGEPIDVNVTSGTLTGDFTPSGLHIAFKVTTMNIPDTATALPAVPLVGRNAMVVTNKDTGQILYVGPSNVTADTVIGTTSGHEINPLEGFNLDIQDDIVLYGRAPVGQTILVKITEIA